MYEFPVATATNDLKPGGLEEYKYILSECWGPEAKNKCAPHLELAKAQG